MANLDIREASYRGTYWNDAPGNTSGRMSPSGEDMLARQNLQSQGRTRGASLRALTMRSPSPQPTRFDPSALSRSMSEAGGLRSLPTQIRDRPASINVNHIRGGQRNYVAKANIDNWVEERFDKNYLPGKARLFERRQYDSMSTMTQREAQAAYVKNHEGRLTCKLPDPRGGKDYRSRTWTRTNLINYASPQPQNLDSKGLYWVGTAPSNMYKSVTATTHGERQKAEFQIRSFGSDGRSRMLKTMKPEHKPDAEVLSTYRAKYNGGASRWQSESAARYTSWVDIAPSLDTRLRAKESMVTDLREAGVQGAGAFN